MIRPMVTASYRCSSGHAFELHFDTDSPTEAPCPTCDRLARRYMKQMGSKACKLRAVRCTPCGKLTEDLLDDEADVCKHCGSDNVVRALVGINIERINDECAPGFPRFDRGLGVVVHSERHRRQEAKKRGLVPIDESTHFSDMARQRAEADMEAKLIAESDDYEERVAQSPDFADYRRAADIGALDPDDTAFVQRCRQEHGARATEA